MCKVYLEYIMDRAMPARTMSTASIPAVFPCKKINYDIGATNRL